MLVSVAVYPLAGVPQAEARTRISREPLGVNPLIAAAAHEIGLPFGRITKTRAPVR
jgi:hypothetical protein